MSYPSDVEYPRRVVVDDTDPRIKYNQGDWAIDNHSFDDITIFGLPYNGTMHGTASATASFSFDFEGEFVQVRGAKDNRKVALPEGVTSDNVTALAKWTCQVDGSPIRTTAYRPYIFDRTNNMLCEQGKLSRGRHTLTVNVTLDDPSTQMFWLDKVEYTPVPDADLSKEVLKFDSSDPAIQVDNSTGLWKSISLFNGTGTTGASASFKFNGTSVSLYGFNEGSDQDWEAATGRYYVDNKGDTTFDITGSKPVPGLPNNRTDWYHQLWFTAANIDPGSHEMILTYTGVYAGKAIQWLSIDYFYVTASEGSKLNSAPPAGGGGGNGSGSSNGQSGSDSKSNTGAIAGGVVGGVLGLALIALAVWFFVKKRKNKDSYGQYDGFQPQNMYSASATHPSVSMYGGQPPASTFSGQPPVSTYSGSYAGSIRGGSSGVVSPAPTGQHSSFTAGAASGAWDPYRDHANSSQGGSNYGGSDSTRSPMVVSNPAAGTSQNWADMKSAQRDAVNSTPVTQRQHQDSGVRYNQPGQVVDVPPTYTEA
ncbi:hypothetical protein PM082_017155 [Marasmius tenuissimus]|nr:hypothetical protein PM082_017155 [Marasmius tenuissimus]